MNPVYGAGISLVVVLSAMAGLYSVQETPVSPVENDTNSESSQVKKTGDGTKYTVHPDKLITGCSPKDCIDSIENPKFVEGNPEWLEDGERVIGLELNGESRAYPLEILSKHEIVNDELEGEPVAVTYCPLCRSGVTYSREVGGEVLEFGVSGKLLNANLVMYDRSTETYWNQITGNAIIGPKVPQSLELVFSSVTTWGEWRQGRPDTKILSRENGDILPSRYERDSYAGYEDSERIGFGVGEVDDRLHPKKLVHGVKIENSSKAYTDEVLEKQRLINDVVGETPVTILKSPEDGTVKAYIREVSGESLKLSLEEGRLSDSEGGRWSFEGEKIDGDAKMETLNPKGFYWFAWSKFNPSTEVYSR